MANGLLIKELSDKLGMNPKTIRFYEDEGVIPKAKRNESNYRVYSEDDYKRLSFIKKARVLGLSIDNIKNIINIRENGNLPHDEVIDFLEKESVDLEKKIKEMIEFKQKLDSCITDFKGHKDMCKKGDICGLIEVLFEE
jgi:DNA-binding transcriptional MerR regulator